jgi:hypothetical protein
MFFFISNAKPLEQLSPIRPHPSIFNLYFFGSLIGQFAAQLAFLIFMYRWGGGEEVAPGAGRRGCTGAGFCGGAFGGDVAGRVREGLLG